MSGSAGIVLNIDNLSNRCANCGRGFRADTKDKCERPNGLNMSKARVSSFFVRNEGKRLQVKVVDALSQIMKFCWLNLDETGQDFPIVLCYECAVTFTQLYQLYLDFSSECTSGSILSIISEYLNETFKKYEKSSMYEEILRRCLLSKPVPRVKNRTVPERTVSKKPEIAQKKSLPSQPPPATTPVARKSTCKTYKRSTGAMVTPARANNKSPNQDPLVNSGRPQGILRDAIGVSAKKPKMAPVIPEPFGCSLCGKKFPSGFQLECHQNYCRKPSDMNAKRLKAKCCLCGLILYYVGDLEDHMRSTHKIDNAKLDFMCAVPGCYTYFASEAAKNRHEDEHKASKAPHAPTCTAQVATNVVENSECSWIPDQNYVEMPGEVVPSEELLEEENPVKHEVIDVEEDPLTVGYS